MVAPQENDDLLDGCFNPPGTVMGLIGHIRGLQKSRQQVACGGVFVRQDMAEVSNILPEEDDS